MEELRKLHPYQKQHQAYHSLIRRHAGLRLTSDPRQTHRPNLSTSLLYSLKPNMAQLWTEVQTKLFLRGLQKLFNMSADMRNEARTLYSPSVQQLQHRPCQQSNQEFSHGKINSANGKIVLEDFSGLAGWHSVVCVCVFVLVLYVCMVIWSWLSYGGITAG